MHGHESQFEEGAIQTLTWMKENVPCVVGWMLLKQIGVSAIGSFQPDPQGMLKATLGATPPYNTNYGDKIHDTPPIPAGTDNVNRSAHPHAAAARRSTLIECLFAVILALACILAALLFDTLLLASGLVFAVRSWRLERRGSAVPADHTIALGECDYEVLPQEPGVSTPTEEEAP